MKQSSPSIPGKPKFLILRFSSIGDIVLTTPVVRVLKKSLNAEVHFLTKSGFASLLQSNPYIDRVFSFDKNIREVSRELMGEKYDLIIDLHHNLRSRMLSWMLRRPVRRFHKINFAKWIKVNLKWDYLPESHIVCRYFETVRGLGLELDGQGLDFFFSLDEMTLKEMVLSRIPALGPEDPYCVFVVGAAHATKKIPVEKAVEIIHALRLPVVLVGGPGDVADSRQIEEQLSFPVVNATGILSLEQSAWVIKNSKVVITPDTGMMHIAAAFHRRIISVWGNTIPAFGMYPYFGNQEQLDTPFQVSSLPCRPCSKIGFSKCPKGHFHCMMKQDSAQIARHANENA